MNASENRKVDDRDDIQAEVDSIINDAMMWRAWLHNRNQLGKTRPATKAVTKVIVDTITAKVAKGEMDRELRI